MTKILLYLPMKCTTRFHVDKETDYLLNIILQRLLNLINNQLIMVTKEHKEIRENQRLFIS